MQDTESTYTYIYYYGDIAPKTKVVTLSQLENELVDLVVHGFEGPFKIDLIDNRTAEKVLTCMDHGQAIFYSEKFKQLFLKFKK